MRKVFEQIIDGRKYSFMPSFLTGQDQHYAITVVDDYKKSLTFRMKRDESDQWKLQAQVLPQWIHDIELELNDAIESSNQES